MSKGNSTYGFRDPRYETFPPVVQVAAVSGICPSKCRYCPMGQKNAGELAAHLADELPVRYFPPDLFRKIADEMAGYPWSLLRVHSRGEPLCHPDYFSMVGYAKTRMPPVTVTSFTNGILLGPNVDQMLQCGLDMLEVSADAADETCYRDWRRNPHFKDVVEGVRRLHAEREKLGRSRPRIVISSVDHPDFRPHRDDFFSFWGPVCDKIMIRPFHTYAGRIADPFAAERQQAEYIPCVQLWERFSVSPEGLANACFNDWGDHEIVGELRKQSIAEIWRGEAFERAREKTLEAPYLQCCEKCSGPSLSSWGKGGYQHWVAELLAESGESR
jgi:pyruvate-formate lyase-activating enzyme